MVNRFKGSRKIIVEDKKKKEGLAGERRSVVVS